MVLDLACRLDLDAYRNLPGTVIGSEIRPVVALLDVLTVATKFLLEVRLDCLVHISTTSAAVSSSVRSNSRYSCPTFLEIPYSGVRAVPVRSTHSFYCLPSRLTPVFLDSYESSVILESAWTI